MHPIAGWHATACDSHAMPKPMSKLAAQAGAVLKHPSGRSSVLPATEHVIWAPLHEQQPCLMLAMTQSLQSTSCNVLICTAANLQDAHSEAGQVPGD